MTGRWRLLISFVGTLVLLGASFVGALLLDPIFGPGLWLANRVLGRTAADGLWLSLGIGMDVVLWSGIIWLLLDVAMGRRARVT